MMLWGREAGLKVNFNEGKSIKTMHQQTEADKRMEVKYLTGIIPTTVKMLDSMKTKPGNQSRVLW